MRYRRGVAVAAIDNVLDSRGATATPYCVEQRRSPLPRSTNSMRLSNARIPRNHAQRVVAHLVAQGRRREHFDIGAPNPLCETCLIGR
jgi:hypothetical protein